MTPIKRGIQKKILFSTLTVGAFSVLLIVTITYLVGTYTIKRTIGDSFKGLAIQTSKKLEILIQDQITVGKTIASLEDVVNAARLSAARYADHGASEVEDRLEERDRLWREGREIRSSLPDPLAANVARDLTTFAGKQRDYIEVLVTDAKGARIAANRRTSGFYFGREPWWQAVLKRRGNYVSDILFDSEVKKWTMVVAVPIEEGGRFLGVVRTIRDVEALLFRQVTDIHVGQHVGQTDHTMLANSSGTLLFCPIFGIRNKDHPLSPDQIRNITQPEPGWGTTTVDLHYPGRESINGFAPVQISFDLGPESFGGTQWYIFTSQDPKKTYAPVETLLKWIAGGGLFSLGLLSILAYYQSRRLVNPIQTLFEGTEIIGGGNLDYCLNIKTGDEIEELANKFNRMTEQLRDSYRFLEQKVEERTRDLKEAQNREKEAQKKLVESARLATLGTLAAGVGHELRNPLTVIKNATFFIRSKIKEADPKVQRHLEILDREVAVSEHIIADLLSFSRVSKPTLRDTDIQSVVAEALSSVEIPDAVRVKTEIGMDLGFFHSDPGYLRQVLTNLISNAVQAMPGGGELKIGAEAQDGKVLITVADTGTGITQENRSKIFEPFFTTKAKGIGLGLAVAKRLVDQLDGRITVNSEPGKGTAFVIEFRTPTEVV